jgi:hypothetical protein
MTSSLRRRCLLVAGGLNHAHNYHRYSHELCWWAERFDSLKYECWMCIADGNHPERPPASVKVTSARRKDVEEGIQWLSGIGENDLGLLVVSNHGDQSGICLWGPDTFTPKEVEQALQPVKGTMVCVMGQCHGGVFGPLANAHTVVLSACRENESSYACPVPPGLAYDEFLYQLGTALFGAPADAQQPGPTRRPLSLLDAFHWARAQDRQKETPMIFDPNGLAGSIFLV